MTVAETLQQEVTPPIEIHGTPWPDQAWALLRQILPPIAAFLIGKGIIDDDTVGVISAVGLIVGPIIVGQLKTRLRATQLAIVEKQVDDTIITTKAKAVP